MQASNVQLCCVTSTPEEPSSSNASSYLDSFYLFIYDSLIIYKRSTKEHRIMRVQFIIQMHTLISPNIHTPLVNEVEKLFGILFMWMPFWLLPPT